MRSEKVDFWVEREVKQLLHFTRIENLPSILRHGLVPRAQLDFGLAKGVTNDGMRLDRRRGYNCLSVSFPNAPMFYRFQRDNPGSQWVILAVTPKILSTHHCLYCWRNAASAEIANAPDQQLSTREAFFGMFLDRDGSVTREKQRLRTCDPTNVQAEVLVRDVITPNYFMGAYFPSQAALTAYQPLIGRLPTKVSNRRAFYGTREYFLGSAKG